MSSTKVHSPHVKSQIHKRDPKKLENAQNFEHIWKVLEARRRGIKARGVELYKDVKRLKKDHSKKQFVGVPIHELKGPPLVEQIKTKREDAVEREVLPYREYKANSRGDKHLTYDDLDITAKVKGDKVVEIQEFGDYVGQKKGEQEDRVQIAEVEQKANVTKMRVKEQKVKIELSNNANRFDLWPVGSVNMETGRGKDAAVYQKRQAKIQLSAKSRELDVRGRQAPA